MSQRKPWRIITRSRNQSLLLGVLWTVVGLLQMVDLLFITDQPSWWRWVLAVLILAMAGYYLATWWTRRRREEAEPRD